VPDPEMEWGPLDALYAAVWRLAPQIACAITAIPPGGDPGIQDPDRCLQVTYRFIGPERVVWDARLGVYRWHGGRDAGAHLGSDSDSDRAAAMIADRLRVPISPPQR